ncbi:hypothetical protein PIB30_052518 [Stylosanthes scabra]|uniref:Ubiquitin-like protease family profile domain-containing protein n=1 Tax=Stylosanthes scabra TaxID=79078 RepID=A0ABU6YH24_9FABA|nr:hypothetical protein [Stylosanthes scabra]
MEFIEKKYMAFADNLLKIYVPLKLKNHFYLMIVDLWDKKVVYLYSAKCSLQLQARRDHMQEVEKYMDGFLTANKFYEDESSIRHKVSDFEFLEPTIGQQKALS